MSLYSDLVTLFTPASHPATKEAAATSWSDSMKLAGNIGVEDWVEVGSGGAPAFQNSFANVAGNVTCAFCKDAFGFVHIKGFVGSGTAGNSIFTLPAGYRPAITETFGCMVNGGAGNVYVSSAGAVVPQTGTTYWGISGITFKAV